MKWSKLKSLIEGRFSQKLKGRVNIHSTCYGKCSCGRAWITIDGKEIANFCTRAYYNKQDDVPYEPNKDSVKAYNDSPVEYGEFSRQDIYETCFEFIHSISVDEALSRNDPLLNSLAILDKKKGKCKLKVIDPSSLHPLVQVLFNFRKQVEFSR